MNEYISKAKLTVPHTTNHLSSHAYRAIVLTVRINSDFRPNDDGLQRILYLAVRVNVANQDLNPIQFF